MDQVSRPYNATNKTVNLYILIFMFVESKLKTQDSRLYDSKPSVSSMSSEFLHEACLTYVPFHSLLHTKRISRSPRRCEVVRNVGTFYGDEFLITLPFPKLLEVTFFLCLFAGRSNFLDNRWLEAL
jgi:hypothetical protein